MPDTQSVRRRPTICQAMQYRADNRALLIAWTNAEHRAFFCGEWHEQDALCIDTGNSTQQARLGDWVVRENGHFAVFSSEQFDHYFDDDELLFPI